MVDELAECSIATAGRHFHAVTGNLPMTSSAMAHNGLLLFGAQVSLDGSRECRQSEESEACKGPHLVVVLDAVNRMQ